MINTRVVVVLLATSALASALQGCSKEGCLAGESGCRVVAPCRKLSFSCEGDTLQLRQLTGAETFLPGGLDALSGKGDVLIGNGQVVAVIAGIGNQNYLDPNGGTLLDLATPGANNDQINQVLMSVGILPRDGVRYTQLELIDERPTRVAVQVWGTLDGRPQIPVHTLYEIRPCDRGVRMRTEIVNGNPQQEVWTIADIFYWSDREPLPFAPGRALGFDAPGFTLTGANEAYRKFPFLAAASHVPPFASYALTSCSEKTLEGFNTSFVSSAGHPKSVVPPREYQVFERFLAVTAGKDVAAAADLALEVRAQLFGEAAVTLRGKIERVGALALDNIRQTSVLISEGSAASEPSERTPWTQVVPDASGNFTARVPSGKDYLIEVHSFGKKRIERELRGVASDQDLGSFTLPSTSKVTISVKAADTADPLNAEIFVIPVDAAGRQAHQGSLHGQFTQCAPWLGPQHGGSPACNRVLIEQGRATVEVPVGRFHFYAFKGPFWTLQRETVTLTEADQALSFSLQKLPLQPSGTLTADLHVHSGISYDSSLPVRDRVLSFSAVDLQIIVSTEHEVIWDFADQIKELGLANQLTSVSGTETTAHIPFLTVPGDAFPRVIGHYNFWPLKFDPTLPRNGGPFDELIEPGQLFDRVDPLYQPGAVPVIQLNHPWGGPYFGRDTGFPRAIHLDLRKDLPVSDDGTNAGMFVRALGTHPNDGHHAQEVMNGTQNDSLLEYRQVWFFMLNQGKLRAGTANSDSHGLTDNTVGVPRNVIYTGTVQGPSFDVNAFNQAIRAGRSFGTNGPVIEASIGGADYGLSLIKPNAFAKLKVKVSAAPWVPVTELRFIVNGKTVKTITGAALSTPENPFGTGGLVRYQSELALAELVTGSDDAWLVIEAGTPLPVAADLGGGLPTREFPDGAPDGVPDTTDNNADGQINAADIAPSEPFGPLKPPPQPQSDADPLYHFAQVVSDGYPMGFTNPFVLDLDGNGRFDPPGQGAR